MSNDQPASCPASHRLKRQQKWVWGAIVAVAAALTLAWTVGTDVFAAGRERGEEEQSKVDVSAFTDLAVRVGKNEEAIQRIDRQLREINRGVNELLRRSGGGD